MALLDGLPRSETQVRQTLELATPIVERILDAADLTPKQREILGLLKKGHSFADIYGLTQEHRDALFAKGCQLVQAGEMKKARDWLTYLNLLDPLDARIIYVIAVTHQTEGNFSVAAKLYVYFIALDPTNPEGYLRLGECHLAAREYDVAAACFELAKYQCDLGKGDAVAAQHAERMLAHAQEKFNETHRQMGKDNRQDNRQDDRNAQNSRKTQAAARDATEAALNKARDAVRSMAHANMARTASVKQSKFN